MADRRDSSSDDRDMDGSDDFDDSFDAGPAEGKADDHRATRVLNASHDEAFEVSASMDSVPTPGGHDRTAARTGNFEEGKMGETSKVTNQHHDEALDLSSDEEHQESMDSTIGDRLDRRGDSPPAMGRDAAPAAEYSMDRQDPHGGSPVHAKDMGSNSPGGGRGGHAAMGRMTGGDESESEEDEEGESTVGGDSKLPEGAYDPARYASLDVSRDVRDLFGHITRYTPRNIDLPTEMKCFIPEYIPAVGEIDPMIKVPRPDGQEDGLGLRVLDEPAAVQTEAHVLDLQLRAMSKKSGLDPVLVRSIEHADKNPRDIERWIASIKDLHRTKPPPQVNYSNAMPDIEALMQEWPAEFEEALRQLDLPSADMDLDVGEYAKVICSILDIPVYGSMVQSLHVLFTLYYEFKNNAHFNNGIDGAGMEGQAQVMSMGK